MKHNTGWLTSFWSTPPSISRASSLWFQRLEEKRYRKELFYILKKITKNCSDFVSSWLALTHLSSLAWRRTRALWTDCSALSSRPEGVLHRGLDPEAPLSSADGSMELLSVVSPLGFAGEFVVILGSLLPLSCLREHLVVFSATLMKAEERLLSRAQGLGVCHAYT